MGRELTAVDIPLLEITYAQRPPYLSCKIKESGQIQSLCGRDQFERTFVQVARYKTLRIPRFRSWLGFSLQGHT